MDAKREELQQKEGKLKRLLRSFRGWEKLHLFSVSAFWPFGDGFLIAMLKIVLHLVPWVFMYTAIVYPLRHWGFP